MGLIQLVNCCRHFINSRINFRYDNDHTILGNIDFFYSNMLTPSLFEVEEMMMTDVYSLFIDFVGSAIHTWFNGDYHISDSIGHQ